MLAAAELHAASGQEVHRDGRLALTETPIRPEILQRLAYTLRGFQVLGRRPLAQLGTIKVKGPVWVEKLGGIASPAADPPAAPKSRTAARLRQPERAMRNAPIREPTTADLLKHVDSTLARDGRILTFIIQGRMCTIGVETFKQPETTGDGFAARHPSLRSGFAPVSSDAKLLRCLVNLTGAKHNQLIVDPFCGTGGILLEAILAGFRAEGSDIDTRMLDKARQNLRNTSVTVTQQDALNRTYDDFIASEFPFGQSTRVTMQPEELYLEFFRRLATSRYRRAALLLPDWARAHLIAKKAGLNVKVNETVYVHKSLSKQILVV